MEDLTELRELIAKFADMPTKLAEYRLLDCIDKRESKLVLEELNEARKWATKADTAEQVWQQLTDRINQLQKERDSTHEDN